MTYDYKAKVKNIRNLNAYMFAKTASMFEYQGLPETIPAGELEKIVQKNGHAFITEVNGKLYAFAGSLGGEQDVYGNPQDITINNVFLNFNKTLKIATDGVLIRNDDMCMGLLPLFDKHNTILAENDINIMLWGYNSRTQKLISAPDDRTKESADTYMKRIIDGDLSVISDNALFDGVKVQPTNSSGGVTPQQLTELHQYVKASMFNEVGISSNFNMKRERLISSELDQAEDSLFPFVYNMMQNRIDAVKALNEKYGLNIDVDFGSIWHYKNKQLVDGVVNNGDLPDESRQEKDPNQSGSGNVDTGNSDPNRQALNDDDNGNGNGGKPTEPAPNPEQTENNDPEKNPVKTEEQKTRDELTAIINSEESTPEDKQAAEELLAEMGEQE